MQQSSKNGRRCLAVSLAAMLAFSAMAASVMSGCGCDDKTGTSTSDETTVIHETQIVTHVETYTEVVVDDEGNTKYVEATRYVSGEGDDASSFDADADSAAVSGTAEASENQSATEKSESSSGSSSSGSSSSGSSSSGSSQKSGSGSSSSSKTSKSTSTDKLQIGGSSFSVGDTVVCTYTLTAPQVLENYQAYITYDSDKLECTNAKMSDAAKSGSLLNYKTQGKIYITGSNISTGYDFTKSGTFLTVTYTVKAGGSASSNLTWQVASNQNSENLISSDGTPSSGFTLSESYAKG